MKMFRSLALATLAATLIGMAAPASANDRQIVEDFYTRLINPAGAPDKMAEAERILAPNFESVGDYSGKNKTRAELAKTLEGFGKLVPDLTWKIEEVLQAGNRYVVRGRATGTPKGPFFGVDGQGKSFTIMSIDIHEVAGGKIVKSYHIEDWAGALRQLSAR